MKTGILILYFTNFFPIGVWLTGQFVTLGFVTLRFYCIYIYIYVYIYIYFFFLLLLLSPILLMKEGGGRVGG